MFVPLKNSAVTVLHTGEACADALPYSHKTDELQEFGIGADDTVVPLDT